MKNTLIASAIAASATLAMVGSAAACSPGYKPVKIQGNWVCQLDASASNSLKARTKPELKRHVHARTLQLRTTQSK